MSNSLNINNTNNTAPKIKSAKVEIYSTALCPYCTRAKSLLEKKGVNYVELRVDKDTGLRAEMEHRSNRTSVPQIFIADKHVGGFDDLVELELDNELDEMLDLPD